MMAPPETSFVAVPSSTSKDIGIYGSTRIRSSTDLYHSLPLPPATASIRLLDLECLGGISTRSDQESLRAVLRVASLNDRPEFTALSYVWGDYATPPDSIRCNGHDLIITRNCREALCTLRKQHAQLTIWVDAICINQEDAVEKSTQVPRMDEIYSWSNLVYVWLGQSTPESTRALKCLKRISCAQVCLAMDGQLSSPSRKTRYLRGVTVVLREGAKVLPWRQYGRNCSTFQELSSLPL